MKRPSRPLLVALAALVVLLAAGWAAYAWWLNGQRAALAAASLPPVPDLAAWPAELRHRIESCERRVREGAEPIEALGELSRLYHANGFTAETLQVYGTLGAVDADEPRWLHRHAIILAGYGEADVALELWRRVTELAPDYLVARLRRADLLLKQNDFAGAAALYQGVLEDDADEPYALLGLARCDFEAGRWAEAQARLERVAEQTDFQLGYDLLVTVYERLGRPDRATAIRGQAMASGAYRDPPDPWMEELYQDCYDVYQLCLSAGAAERNGDPATALRRLERALRFAPEQPSVHFQLGLFHVNRNESAKARQHLERCTQLNPQFADAWSHLSQLLLNGGDRAGSDRAIAQGLVHNPESYALHLMRARRAQEVGRVDEAIRDYQTAIRLRPNSADPRIELAIVYFRRNRLDEGAAELRAALAAEPEHPIALSTLAVHAISVGDEAAARHWLQRCRQQPRVQPQRIQEIVTAFRRQFGHAPD